jgi:DNA-binding CsgD family transcriptional regulator
MEKNYIAIDPVHRGVMRTALPFSWSADTFAGDRSVAEYFDDAAACDIRSGLSFIVPSPRPRRLQILIAYTSAPSITPEHARAAAADLWALGAYGHAILRRTGVAPDLSSPGQRGLTAREYECLLLVAEGATSRDIALALSISTRTVDAHVTQAVKKLGAQNRREAVAIALGEGVLRRLPRLERR